MMYAPAVLLIRIICASIRVPASIESSPSGPKLWGMCTAFLPVLWLEELSHVRDRQANVLQKRQQEWNQRVKHLTKHTQSTHTQEANLSDRCIAACASAVARVAACLAAYLVAQLEEQEHLHAFILRGTIGIRRLRLADILSGNFIAKPTN